MVKHQLSDSCQQLISVFGISHANSILTGYCYSPWKGLDVLIYYAFNNSNPFYTLVLICMLVRVIHIDWIHQTLNSIWPPNLKDRFSLARLLAWIPMELVAMSLNNWKGNLKSRDTSNLLLTLTLLVSLCLES